MDGPHGMLIGRGPWAGMVLAWGVGTVTAQTVWVLDPANPTQAFYEYTLDNTSLVPHPYWTDTFWNIFNGQVQVLGGEDPVASVVTDLTISGWPSIPWGFIEENRMNKARRSANTATGSPCSWTPPRRMSRR